MSRPQRLPPLHALSAFESAARLGGFGQAAAELCITPSAVSHRIRQLETQLGEALFDRLPTGVRLNDAGQRYLHGVREAFDKLAQLSCASEADVPHLTVGLPPTFARNLLIPRLPEFYRLWPDVEIEVAVVMPMQDKPDRHDLDIRFGSPPFDDRPCTRLFDDVLVVLAAPAWLARHPLAQPADLAQAELLRSPLVPWRAWFSAADLDWPEPSRGAVFTDLGILLEAAASGMGLALCPQRVAAGWVAQGQLVQPLTLSAPAPSHYHLLVSRDQAQRPAVAAFTDWLGSAFA
jgi:DNA-binding transcriptional LysR family regulator